MPLRAHLSELRTRSLRSAIGLLVGAVVGWFLYDPVFQALQQPILEVTAQQGRTAELNFAGVGSSFDLKIKVSLFLGVLVSSPVWIYQLWAFVTPGLTRKERRYAVGFMIVAVPLFLTGAYLASLVLPNAVGFLTAFTPTEASNIIDAREYLSFVMRVILAFGMAFLLPVVLVGLNLVGLLSGRAMIAGWRIGVFLVFLFAAMATPTPDAVSMLALAFPMLSLFAIAVGISLLNDRRRRQRQAAALAELDREYGTG